MKITVQFNKDYCERALKDTEDTCVVIENVATYRRFEHDRDIVEITGGSLKMSSKPSGTSIESTPIDDGDYTGTLRYRLRDTEYVKIEPDDEDLKAIREVRGNESLSGASIETRWLRREKGGDLTMRSVGYITKNTKDILSIGQTWFDCFGSRTAHEDIEIVWDDVIGIEILKRP